MPDPQKPSSRKSNSRLNDEEREVRIQEMLERARRHEADAQRLREAAKQLQDTTTKDKKKPKR